MEEETAKEVWARLEDQTRKDVDGWTNIMAGFGEVKRETAKQQNFSGPQPRYDPVLDGLPEKEIQQRYQAIMRDVKGVPALTAKQKTWAQKDWSQQLLLKQEAQQAEDKSREVTVLVDYDE